MDYYWLMCLINFANIVRWGGGVELVDVGMVWDSYVKRKGTARILLGRVCCALDSVVFLVESLLIPLARALYYSLFTLSPLLYVRLRGNDYRHKKIVGPFCPCSLWTCSFISRHLINESALIVRRAGALTWRAFLFLSSESNKTIRLSLIIAYFISSNYSGDITFDEC